MYILNPLIELYYLGFPYPVTTQLPSLWIKVLLLWKWYMTSGGEAVLFIYLSINTCFLCVLCTVYAYSVLFLFMLTFYYYSLCLLCTIMVLYTDETKLFLFYFHGYDFWYYYLYHIVSNLYKHTCTVSFQTYLNCFQM